LLLCSISHRALSKSLKNHYRKSLFFEDKETVHAISPEDVQVKFTAYLCMKTANGTILNGWTPSQEDMLANDWCILE